ncbi:MAG: glycosyltransferase family 2 protein [Phycisphaerae bacterium]|nr:glycosyltransferase family 2 protein [Phycisphaerae bacterium]
MPERPKILLAIPVYNEAGYVPKVLAEVATYVGAYVDSVLVVDDGSTDRTPMELAQHRVEVIRHAENRGYGRSMMDMFRWAAFDRFDWLITMDCDEQHEPASIPAFVDAILADDADVVSGSRYLAQTPLDDLPPSDRRHINRLMTDEVNARLGLALTDTFCGFKAYRTSALERLRLDVDGYDFPMQFWPQAVAHGLVIREIPVRLIYNDPNRTFGGPLNDPARRIMVYRSTLHRELCRLRTMLPSNAVAGIPAESCRRGDCNAEWGACG